MSKEPLPIVIITVLAALAGIVTCVLSVLVFITGRATLCAYVSVPLLCPRPVVQQYDPVRDVDAIDVRARIENWRERKTPGYQRWIVDLPHGRPALVSIGWCAIDMQTLDSNWSRLRYYLTIDDMTIDMDDLVPTTATYNTTDPRRYCRSYAVVVTNWTRGRHSYTWRYWMLNDVFDGVESYPYGEYTEEFVVDVR